MDWSDEENEPSTRRAATMAVVYARQWPIVAVYILSAAGFVLALIGWLAGSPPLAAATYAVLLLGGCGLLGYRRYDAILATRSAGGSGVMVIQPVEKVAISVLVIACLAAGAVVALALARGQ